MKTKTLLSIFLLAAAGVTLKAQVKIGDNPNTINSNSLFEMESTNKGLLPPRVIISSLTSASPLTAPVTAGMLVYSSGGAVTDGYYVWNGTKWNLINTSVSRNNFVLVKSAADFPAPESGIITLVAGTEYEINGTITLTSKIDLNGCSIIGTDEVNDKLVYTPASGELFTGTNGGSINRLTLYAPNAGSMLFNIDAGNAYKNLVFQNCYVLGCDNIGLIKGFGGSVFINTVAYLANKNGMTFQNINNVFTISALWDSTNHNTYEKYVGTFSVILKLGGAAYMKAANSAVALDVSGITSISGGATLKTTLLIGDGTYVNGSFSNKWEVETYGLTTEKDDVASGNIYVSTPVATTFTAANTPTKMLGTTTSANLFRVSNSANNKMAYTGSKTRRFMVTCSISFISAGNNKNYSFYVSKNGVALPESEMFTKINTGADQQSVPISCTVSLSTSDYIEVWCENNTDNTAMTVTNFNLAIK